MKNKVLVLTSTFPKWKNDTTPPFVYELEKRLTKDFEIHILTPHFPGSKNIEMMNKLKIYRFHYFFEKFEKLAGKNGVLPTLKVNKWFYLVVPFFFFFEIIATLKLVKKLRPDVIHAHWIIPQGLVAYINYIINKTPYVVTSHGSDLHSLGLVFLKKIILNKAKKITVVSSYLNEKIKEINPDLILKTEIIPMGVDTKRFNSNKYDERIKKKYNITGSFLLFVGRLAEIKGVENLIRAMPMVVGKFPKTKLLIIGSGSLDVQLKKITKDLYLTNNVTFLDGIPNYKLPKYYATADIFISPSLNSNKQKEGFGLTLVEAGMSGCSLVAVNSGGMRDIVQNNKNGILLNSSNPKLISEAVIRLIKYPGLFDKKETMKKFTDKFDFEHVCNNYGKLYKNYSPI